MKSAQLHENIRYVSLTDDDGDFGILLHHDGDYVYAAVEVDSRETFTVFGSIDPNFGKALLTSRDLL